MKENKMKENKKTRRKRARVKEECGSLQNTDKIEKETPCLPKFRLLKNSRVVRREIQRVRSTTAKVAKIKPRTLETVTVSLRKIMPKMAGMTRFRLKMGMTTESGPRAMAV